mmetsp:Transcript_6079/g.14714  ORF Transcript_6079/g.14714 Transcript_6079/m.14714 type:complete len:456 (-) Transcript_6079:43-1410(-)
MFLQSISKSSLSPGRWIFTTTFFPPISARCTCPREAAAMGSGSKESKVSSMVAPRLSSTVRRAVSQSKGGTLSCSFSSSFTNSGASTSTRVENCCPILMKVGPRRTSCSRSQTASSVLRALTAAGVIPSFPKVNFFPRRKYRNANLMANVHIWSVRWITPYDLNWFQRPPGFSYGDLAAAGAAFSSSAFATFASSALAGPAGAPFGLSALGGALSLAAAGTVAAASSSCPASWGAIRSSPVRSAAGSSDAPLLCRCFFAAAASCRRISSSSSLSAAASLPLPAKYSVASTGPLPLVATAPLLPLLPLVPLVPLVVAATAAAAAGAPLRCVAPSPGGLPLGLASTHPSSVRISVEVEGLEGCRGTARRQRGARHPPKPGCGGAARRLAAGRTRGGAAEARGLMATLTRGLLMAGCQGSTIWRDVVECPWGTRSGKFASRDCTFSHLEVPVCLRHRK